ncbi:MAG: TetR/AcrR family transcriptional regulator [Deltaproteobacteria bacterium]|nr:TetR/AcrR family transcriptional regulator [Deltaproteobacteria bacterium]
MITSRLVVPREKSSPPSPRKAQITEAALELLADTPMHALRTRQIARHVGVSQPALFRHFRSRDAILEAVVDLLRERLSAAVVTLLEGTPAPLDRARGLVGLLFEHATRDPGLVRLILAEGVGNDEGVYHASLAHLVSMQRSFFTTFVRRARERGEVASNVDPDVASQLIMALIQGTLLEWARGRRIDALESWAPRVSSSWEAGLGPGNVVYGAAGLAAVPEAPDLRLALLDVRPILDAGDDPLGAIRSMLGRLSPDGMAVVQAPFAPRPLRTLLIEEGYRAEIEELGDREFQVTILGPDAADLIDLTSLEAPLPLERVLAATTTLEPGATAHFRTPMVPRILLPRLAERGVEHEACKQLDGRGLLTIWRTR